MCLLFAGKVNKAKMKERLFEAKKGSRVYTSGMRTLVVIVERSKEARKRLSLFSHTLSSCRVKR